MKADPLRPPAAPRPRARLTARDVMTPRVFTVHPETPVKEVAAAMVGHHVSGLPVVTGDGEVVGIITETDLLHKERGPRPPARGVRTVWRSFTRTTNIARKAEGLTAAELMTSPAIGVEEATPLHEIAALMVRRQINRVPVMRAGDLVGIVSRADIVRAFTRADADIAAAVRATLLHDLWVDVTRIGIEVRDGVVALDGVVERRSERDLVTRWVEAVDGVVAVGSRLQYEYDDRSVHLGDRWPAPRA